MEEKKDLAVQTAAALPALPDPVTLKEMLEENLGGLEASFETVKMPTGGMTVWSVPGDYDEPEIVKELVGVVLQHYSVRAYWKAKYGQGGSGGPPDCASLDCIKGSLPRNANGEFGECHSCKWAQFGTATKEDGSPGKGQACGLKHRVFLLMPERSFFPYLIPLSTTSTTKRYEGSISTYVIKLAGKGKKLAHVRTKIKLIEDRNADGIKYAKAQFFPTGDLNDEEKKQIDAIRAMLETAMKNKPVEEAEVMDADTQLGEQSAQNAERGAVPPGAESGDEGWMKS
jgi:hypothetical protein